MWQFVSITIRLLIQNLGFPSASMKTPLYDPNADPNDRYKLGWGKNAGQAARFYKGIPRQWLEKAEKEEKAKEAAAAAALATQVQNRGSNIAERQVVSCKTPKGLGDESRATRKPSTGTVSWPCQTGSATTSAQRPDIVPLLGGKISNDNLSTVLSMPNSFNPIWTEPGAVPRNEEVGWPTQQEMNQDGDARARRDGGLRRFMPLPRRNHVDPRLAHTSDALALKPGDRVPWNLREVTGERWDLHEYQRQIERIYPEPAEEVSFEEAPESIRALIDEIDEMTG